MPRPIIDVPRGKVKGKNVLVLALSHPVALERKGLAQENQPFSL